MRSEQHGLFGGERMQMDETIRLTLEGLNAYLPNYETVAAAISGGKDSTCLLTVLIWAILKRHVPAPRRLVILYADTRLELPPLYAVIDGVLDDLEEHRAALLKLGCDLIVQRVMAPVERRFFTQILGRGIPPSHNKFRWCTPKLKLEPMALTLAQLRATLGGPKPLLLHGVRIGESAARDGRIALACSKEDSECGQGWYQQELDDALCDKLGPLLHWRVCHVARWLDTWAPEAEYGGWDTSLLVRAYGGEEKMEVGARTGCVGCPLVTEDHALARILLLPEWRHLAPLARLKPLYERLRSPTMRLRKPPGERTLTGALVKKQERLGPLTLAARTDALDEVLCIQDEVNTMAIARGRPLIDLLNHEEIARILELQRDGEWPDGWDGDEPVGETTLMPLFQDR
jgi:DNA sulfur modification protein DndC